MKNEIKKSLINIDIVKFSLVTIKTNNDIMHVYINVTDKEKYLININSLDNLVDYIIETNYVNIEIEISTSIHETFRYIKKTFKNLIIKDKLIHLSIQVEDIMKYVNMIVEKDKKYRYILNPTENIPYILRDYKEVEGLYINDEIRNYDSKLVFGGHNKYAVVINKIKKYWAEILNSYDVDFRCFSGLNAHLILFMCIVQEGQKVMILPEVCGGHSNTSTILERLGVEVINMIPDIKNLKVDIEKTKRVINEERPCYIFVDRSFGLYYEDFSWLKQYKNIYKIFDASQYLTHIIAGDYINPYDMGFNMIISTLHKNFPGPQKAIVSTKINDEIWKRYRGESKPLFSNLHPRDILNSIFPISNIEWMRNYSKKIFNYKKILEKKLIEEHIKMPFNDPNEIKAPQTWIIFDNKKSAYTAFKYLESHNIQTNYCLLPYELGYGLRLGYAGLISQGYDVDVIDKISHEIIYSYQLH